MIKRSLQNFEAKNIFSSAIFYNGLIITLSILLFVPFLGSVHLFDWDEINFAECAREMLVSKNYSVVQINFQPFWEKPPLFIWMQVLSMKLFGMNEFAARFPNAICGIITLLLIFNIGTYIYNAQFGLLWVLAYAGSFLPHFYFKSGIIDPWFNLFIFLGIYFFMLFTNKKNTTSKTLILSALFIGLGIMTKGPVALLIFGLCGGSYFIVERFKINITLQQILIYTIVVLSIGGLWFFIEALLGHTAIIIEFFNYQIRLLKTEDAGHGGPFYYHFLILLIGCFPASIFAISAFRKNLGDNFLQLHTKKWMLILFFVVLILFSIVKTKIVHYSSLTYFPLTYLAAYSIYKLLAKQIKWQKWMSYACLSVAFLLGLALAILPFVDRYKQKIIASNLIHDAFAVANLQANVLWNGYEFLIGIFFLAGIIFMLLLIKKQKLKTGILGIFFVSLITVNLATIILVPKIEKYSQGAAIEFYESLQNKNCYVETIGFKSYAHLFYTQKPIHSNSQQETSILTGETDKPAYFVSKITEEQNIKQNYPQLEELYRKNGFIFFKQKTFAP